MFLFILGVLLLLSAILLYAGWRAEKKKATPNPTPGALAFFAALIGIAMLVFSVVTSVPARSVGVATAFGKPVATYDNGLHLKAPWWKVHDMDGTIQNDVYNGDNQVDVRLANNAKAKVDASVQWRLKTDGAMEAFLNYKDADIEKIQANTIDRNLKSAVNEVMASYDPLNASNPATGNEDLGEYQKKILAKLQDKADGQVEVISVTIPNINFDDATQQRIDQYQAEVAKTRNAEQAKKTAQQEADANRILDDSITDETNTSKCLDIVKDSGQSPLGCFPGSGAQPVKNVG